ncbi:MAG: autoinducer 2 ABC transporter substrate-binding protein [Rubrobacteraceae bacterium]|nr:autoinducer 2 ABC transporter substrate-binding protein [Rubrobacteraceae bacterium]
MGKRSKTIKTDKDSGLDRLKQQHSLEGVKVVSGRERSNVVVRGKYISIAISLALLFGIATACGGSGSGGSGSGGGNNQPTIAFVPKLIGIPYFDAMQKGGQEAAKDLGVKFIYQGPSTADSAAQIQTIDGLIQRHVDAIAVAPNDPSAVKPILQKAKSAGIKVYTTDTDAPNTVRQVFDMQATSKAIGEATIDALASQMGGKGKWAIVSCGPTAQNLNSWIKVEKKRALQKYPGMKLIGVQYAGEDQQKAKQIAQQLMTANPDLKGLIGQCSTSAPGVAQAIQAQHKIGKVYSTGVATPTAMAKYIKNGAMAKVVLWNPVNLGYLTVWTGKQLVEGKSFSGTENVGGPVGKVKYLPKQKALLLGPPLVFTKKNIDKYNGKF